MAIGEKKNNMMGKVKQVHAGSSSNASDLYSGSTLFEALLGHDYPEVFMVFSVPSHTCRNSSLTTPRPCPFIFNFQFITALTHTRNASSELPHVSTHFGVTIRML
jgi:hypothetical protein